MRQSGQRSLSNRMGDNLDAAHCKQSGLFLANGDFCQRSTEDFHSRSVWRQMGRVAGVVVFRIPLREVRYGNGQKRALQAVEQQHDRCDRRGYDVRRFGSDARFFCRQVQLLQFKDRFEHQSFLVVAFRIPD